MRKLFEQFLREKQYLINLQPRTLDIYEQIYDRYFRDTMPTQASLQECVMKLREKGLATIRGAGDS